MKAPAEPRAGMRSVFYAGRRRDVRAPPGWLQLSSWDALPVRMGPLLDEAQQLIVVDAMSFPFDAMRDGDRDIPIAVQLPSEWDAETLVALLEKPLFEEVTAFDRLSVAEEQTWSTLQARYAWPDTIRARDALAPAPGSRRRKSTHRQLRRAIVQQLRDARDAVPVGETLAALLLADDPEEWHAVLASSPARVETEATDVPEPEPERVHVALSVAALCERGDEERRDRLSRLLRALRVGGRLIVVDRFLDGARGRHIGAPSPRELISDVQRSCARHVVLEQIEAFRLRGDALTSIGLFAFTKLGRPERL